MSKAARARAARRQTPPPVGKRQPLSQRAIWLGAGTQPVGAIKSLLTHIRRCTEEADRDASRGLAGTRQRSAS